jgi:hypothetical protein
MVRNANHSRLTEMSHGWTFEFLEDATGSVDDRISRLDEASASDAPMQWGTQRHSACP